MSDWSIYLDVLHMIERSKNSEKLYSTTPKGMLLSLSQVENHIIVSLIQNSWAFTDNYTSSSSHMAAKCLCNAFSYHFDVIPSHVVRYC